MVITVECPTCSATFPVDPNKIPEAGVNARCSSCGHVIRVERPKPVEEAPVVPEVAVDATPEPIAEAEPEPEPEPEPVVEEAPEAEAAYEVELADEAQVVTEAPSSVDRESEPALYSEPEVIEAVVDPVTEDAPPDEDSGIVDSPDDWVIEPEVSVDPDDVEISPEGRGPMPFRHLHVETALTEDTMSSGRFFGGESATEEPAAQEAPPEPSFGEPPAAESEEDLPSFGAEPAVDDSDDGLPSFGEAPVTEGEEALPSFGAEPVAEEPADELPSFGEVSVVEDVAAPEPEEAAPAVRGFTFGKRDPKEKAKRLARVLVSDMISYNADRHMNAVASGTLKEDFEEEIDKSWKEYVEQVGPEMAEGDGQGFWREALNDVLAEGESIF